MKTRAVYAMTSSLKAISLWQPWASLIVYPDGLNRKIFETRSWDTSHRGLVLIHAAARLPRAALELARQEQFASSLKSDPYWSLHRGMVIGAAELKATYKLTEETRDKILFAAPQQALFGDFRDGRYAWEFSHAAAFSEPFVWRGMQKFFDVPARSAVLATEQWKEHPEWWDSVVGSPGCLCETCRSYGA